MEACLKVALLGNPNSGKTTVFNALTGLNQKVGNWPGVTVDKKMGQAILGSVKLDIIDLPGIYALSFSEGQPSGLDEKITCQYLLEETPDVIINVIDASNLERNLYLTLELLEMGLPIVVVLNMMDVAEKRKQPLNPVQLSKKLGCPVVPFVAHKKTGLQELQKVLLNLPKKHQYNKWQAYAPDLAQAVEDLCQHLPQTLKSHPQLGMAWFASRLLEEETAFSLEKDSVFEEYVKTLRDSLACAQQMDCDLRIADARYEVIHQLVHHDMDATPGSGPHASELVDRVVLNRVLGLPIFFLVMYLMFECAITLGGALQPFFDIVSQTVIGEGLTALGSFLGAPQIVLILLDSLGLGINTVLTFTPQIAALFFCLSVLERSGYMSRAAFVMDRFMQWVGLPGKSFVPLIVGFGCNVPSVMAARTLDAHRDRVITILMAPFMSCGARLAIFAVFASAFFPQHGAFVVFSLYCIGIVVALLTGIVMKYTLLKGDPAPFMMELPPYHRPMLKILALDMLRRVKSFIVRAGKVILPFCVVIGCLNTITWGNQSILENLGKRITPIFSPMGISQENWPATIGLLTGTVAKEVVIGTLNTLYTQESPVIGQTLKEYHPWEGIKQGAREVVQGLQRLGWSELTNPFAASKPDSSMDRSAMGHMLIAFGSSREAFAYMLFILLYMPCISTIAASSREAGHGWSLLSTGWSTSIAYCLAVLCYQWMFILEHPLQTLLWSASILIYLSCLIASFVWWANHAKS